QVPASSILRFCPINNSSTSRLHKQTANMFAPPSPMAQTASARSREPQARNTIGNAALPKLALLRHHDATPSSSLPGGVRRPCRKRGLRSESDVCCAPARLDPPHMSRPATIPKNLFRLPAPRGERERIGWPALLFGSQPWDGRIDGFASDADDLDPVIDAKFL